MTGTYKKITTPASVVNVEDTLQCIYEASSLSTLLASISDGNEMDDDAISEIGNTLFRLLSQPMECVGQVISDKQTNAAVEQIGTKADIKRRIEERDKQTTGFISPQNRQSKFTDQEMNEFTLRVYYVRSLIAAASTITGELQAAANGLAESREAFDLSALLDIASERLTDIAENLSKR